MEQPDGVGINPINVNLPVTADGRTPDVRVEPPESLFERFGWLYAFFRVVTGLRVRRLPDHGVLLRTQGFRLERELVARFGLLTSQLWRRD